MISVAHFWNKTPEEFEALPPRTQSRMAAYYFVKHEIENYYQEESMREKPKANRRER